jgi:hypothetical protein
MCDLQSIWDRIKWFVLIGSFIIGFMLVAFLPMGSVPYALGIILLFIGVVGSIYLKSKENFWSSNLFLIIVLAVFIGYLMTAFTISQEKIEGLLALYITIDTAIIAISFAAIAIKPESFISIKKEFRDFLLLTSFWILLSILIYCLSFFDIFNVSYGFKFLLAITTIIQIVLIFNLMFFTTDMFNRIVPTEQK